MNKYLIGSLVVIAIIAFYTLSTYNNIVAANTAVDSQWAQVETQYQRRFDLIPNVVNTVKGFAGQEQKVFADIAEARTKYSGAQTVDDKVQAANQVESALGRLLVIAENYPDLKSSQLFSDLNVELEGTENRISVERGRFNDQVKAYNLLIQTFPSSLVASHFGFAMRTYFQADQAAATAPVVNF